MVNNGSDTNAPKGQSKYEQLVRSSYSLVETRTRQDIQARGSPQSQVRSFFEGIEYGAMTAFSDYQVIPDCYIEVNSGRRFGTKERSQCIDEENRILFDKAGFFKDT